MDISSLRERSTSDVMSVSALNSYIKTLVENDRVLSSVSVQGEISNFVYHRSGHLYFTLKDNESQIKAVMFKSAALRLKFLPENGMKVTVRGSVSVYQKDGVYNIYAVSMQPDGIGGLYLAYEQLKERLALEGLFSSAHKKTIPKFPESVGVITSPTGAAVRDIINVITRRFPLAKIYLYPSLVQGEYAPDNLIEGIDYFESSRLADVIIIGRGGGSLEDLWAFNSEALARKIYDASTPIISAVGHETDFTICDFVADLRAPTPSAAAEICVPDSKEIMLRIDNSTERSLIALSHIIENGWQRLKNVLGSNIIKKPDLIFEKQKTALKELNSQIHDSFMSILQNKRTSFMLNLEMLKALNPLAVLSRGYAIAEKNGEVLSDVKNLSIGDNINIRLSHGALTVRIQSINTEKDVTCNE